MINKLSSFPKFKLLDGPTPIQELTRLNESLNGVKVFVKRDDLMGLGLGGSKLRKLEYLLGEAIEQKANHIITTGATQSNHARLTGAASAKAGLKCDLFLTRTVPIFTTDYTDNGNTVLNTIFGATVHDLDKDAKVQDLVNERILTLKAAGTTPYFIPTGGSSPVGCLGYANCAQEILAQMSEADIRIDQVIVPNGSSGTHAGLLAGFIAAGANQIHVKSYNVLAQPADALKNTYEKARATLNLMNDELAIAVTDIDINHSYLGLGYGIPTAEMINALTFLARTEGLLLDPVYSGKAFAGLLGDIEHGVFSKGDNILFIMTGGSPGLFAYRSVFERL